MLKFLLHGAALLLAPIPLILGCGPDDPSTAPGLPPPPPPDAEEYLAPVDTPATHALEATLQAVIQGPNPLRALARLDAGLDSLGTGADPDSLPVWALSAAVNALAPPNAVGALDSISHVLADTVDAVLDHDPADGEHMDKAEGCRPPAVLYVNGIGTTLEFYRMSKRALRSALQRAGIDWPVYGAYNVSATDAERSVFGGRICPLFQYLPFGTPDLASACTSLGGFAVDLSEASAQEIQQWANFDFFRPADVERVARAILRHLKGRRGLVIVAHSQGNLMVNQAVESLLASGRLTTDAKLRLVRLGSPIDSGPIAIQRRFDVCGDIVSALAGFGSSNCLEPPPLCAGWGICPHNFLNSYMYRPNRAAIVAAIQELGQQLLDRDSLEDVQRYMVAVSAYHFGVELVGRVGCLDGTRVVRATLYRASRGPTDPEQQVLGPETVTPSRPDFTLSSEALESCETYIATIELLRAGVATYGLTLDFDTGDRGAGGASDYVLFAPAEATSGWAPNGNISHSRTSGEARSSSNVYLSNRPAMEGNSLEVRQIWLLGGQIDELQAWSSQCATEGVIVALSGSGRESVRIINDDGNEQNVTLNGSVHLEVLDRRGEGPDVVDMYFEVAPGQHYGDRAQPGPFRAELGAAGVTVVLGR